MCKEERRRSDGGREEEGWGWGGGRESLIQTHSNFREWVGGEFLIQSHSNSREREREREANIDWNPLSIHFILQPEVT